jgi:hypothetical protein
MGRRISEPKMISFSLVKWGMIIGSVASTWSRINEFIKFVQGWVKVNFGMAISVGWCVRSHNDLIRGVTAESKCKQQMMEEMWECLHFEGEYTKGKQATYCLYEGIYFILDPLPFNQNGRMLFTLINTHTILEYSM